MNDLANRRCRPCEGGSPLSRTEAVRLVAALSGWTIADDGRSIERTFSFKNYWRTMAFVNAVAWIAHAEDHHPDLEVGYSRCTVRYSTHAVGGLSENDFICAAKIDLLATSLPN